MVTYCGFRILVLAVGFVVMPILLPTQVRSAATGNALVENQPTLAATLAAARSAPHAREINAVVLHPFIAQRFFCSDHYDGEFSTVFDALGTDCVALVDGKEYRTDGNHNEDYYIWGQAVLAPFDGTVASITVNPVTNEPGTMGKSPATSVVFRRADGVLAGYAHVDKIKVQVGDSVHAGQVVASVSNNGMSSGPHVHIGAWRGEEPLQIRWDQQAIARLRRAN